MKPRFHYFFIAFVFFKSGLFSQNILVENFGAGDQLPAGWSVSDDRCLPSNTVASNTYTTPIQASGGGNVVFRNCQPDGTDVTLISPIYDFSGITGIILGFGYRKTSTGAAISLYYSINGGPQQLVTSVTGATTWAYATAQVSALDNQDNVQFFFTISANSGNNSCDQFAGNTRIDDFAIIQNNQLPVTLVSFTAEPSNAGVDLRFSTASEQNNAFFAIERSAEGIFWEEIGQVPGAGNSAELKEYHFTDRRPLAGINYYRLAQVDLDGSRVYSALVSVTLKRQTALQLYPSPANALLQFNLAEKPRTEGIWEIFDLTGGLVARGSVEPEITMYQVNTDPLLPGTYLLHLTVDRTVLVKRFEKG